MSEESFLKPENWRDFKTKWTNENLLIAQAILKLFPREDCHFVLDVGAGLGDIASIVYPDKKAVLLDILPYEMSVHPRHQRVCQSFFDYASDRLPPQSLLLFSHSLQYLDDDLPRLLQKIEQMDPQYIVDVLDENTPFQQKAVNWLTAQNVAVNAERDIPGFPGRQYTLLQSQRLQAEIKCETFEGLARQLGCMIYDAALSPQVILDFAKWLQTELCEPCIQMPQIVRLFGRKL